MIAEEMIGKEVFVYGLGYIVWDRENAEAAQELFDEIKLIATEPATFGHVRETGKFQ